MLKIKDMEKFKSYGFIENENLRTKNSKYYVLEKTTDTCKYQVDVFFVVYNDGTLSFDASSYPLEEYEIYDIANVIYEMTTVGLVEKVEE